MAHSLEEAIRPGAYKGSIDVATERRLKAAAKRKAQLSSLERRIVNDTEGALHGARRPHRCHRCRHAPPSRATPAPGRVAPMPCPASSPPPTMLPISAASRLPPNPAPLAFPHVLHARSAVR